MHNDDVSFQLSMRERTHVVSFLEEVGQFILNRRFLSDRVPLGSTSSLSYNELQTPGVLGFSIPKTNLR